MHPIKIVRRLAAAEGYLELGLADCALVELSHIEDGAEFQAIADLLRGEALQAEGRFEEAIGPLKRAAEQFPSPLCQRAWASLTTCCEHTGNSELAAYAQEAMTRDTTGSPNVVVHVAIGPVFAGNGSGR